MTSLAATSVDSCGAAPRRGPWAVMRSVLFALGLRELKTRLGGQWTGLVWTVGEPLASVVMFLAVYAVLRAQTVAGVDPLLFLVSGLLPFQLFKTLVLRSMEAIDANQGLLGYRQVRPIDAVIARGAVETLLGCAMLVAAASVLVWLGHDLRPAEPLELLGASAMLVALGTSFGLLAAVATAGAWSRLRSVVRVAFVPVYLASGAVFPLAAVPEAVRSWLMLSPVAQLLESLRGALFGDQYLGAPEASLATAASWTLVGLTLSLLAYRAGRDRVMAH